MMKNLFLFLIFAISIQNLAAQEDCSVFFPFEKGKQLVYNHYDGDGNLVNTSEVSVLMIRDAPDSSIEAEISSVVRDNEGVEDFTGEYVISCKEGALNMDITSTLSPAMIKPFQGMELTLKGDYVSLPNELEVGQNLPSAITNVSAGKDGVQVVSMDIRVTRREVEGKNEITTPAGTFSSYKVTQTTSVEMMITKSFDITEYYAVGVGLVRSETRNRGGELVGYMELDSIKGER
jgi:hypothetical protein